jgi:UDPglucose 6-dehydrogenase
MKVAVLGLWHLGCVTAACCAEHFSVIGLDFDEATIAKLKSGRAPVFEPGLDELIQAGLESGRLSFTADAIKALEGADVLWVCYDTPVNEEDVADIGFILDRLARCLPHLAGGAMVLISSQLPAGTCRRLEEENAAKNVSFAVSPENLRLGKALEIFRKPGRIIAGTRTSAAQEKLAQLFAPFCDRVIWMKPESAEMTKHGINAFLALSVTFANELARLCEATGADAREVEQGLRSEPRIGEKAYIRPGSAFAGGTLARDVVTLGALARENGQEAELVAAILRSNETHKAWPLRRLESFFGELQGRTIALLGLSYKAGTDTLRRSAALELCGDLLGMGCHVRCYDPVVRALPPDFDAARICSGLPEAVKDADAIVVATEWPEFTQANWPGLLPSMRQPAVVIDANRFLRLDADRLGEVRYFAVGSPR